MTQLNGFFSLRTPRDLLAKVEADYCRMKAADPGSVDAQYAAFDFFVGANHLPDWVQQPTGKSKSDLRNYQDGALVDHVASGAKHFRVTVERHTTAKQTRLVDGLWKRGLWAPGVWARGVWAEARLVIDLEDGTSIDAFEVAERVLQHWKQAIR
jgi:hypothetical protein